VERGARTYSVIGRARGARGRIRFTPADGRRGRRDVLAVVERDGVVVRSLRVARYEAPSPARPGRPRAVRVTRRGGTVVVRWRGVPGVRTYAVTLQLRNAPAVLRVTRRHVVRFGGVARGARGVVLVGGLGIGSATGKQARAVVPRR
jgi:hypothetical protein